MRVVNKSHRTDKQDDNTEYHTQACNQSAKPLHFELKSQYLKSG